MRKDGFSLWVSFAVIFYDGVSGRLVPPRKLIYRINGSNALPLFKKEGYAVFVNLPQGDHILEVGSTMYPWQPLHILWGEDELPIWQVTLFPQQSAQETICCCAGQAPGLQSIRAILEEEDTMITVADYDPLQHRMVLQNRKKMVMTGSVAAYNPKEKWFYEIFLKDFESVTGCRINGEYQPAQLVGTRLCRIFGSSVDKEGRYGILLPGNADKLLLRFVTDQGIRFQSMVRYDKGGKEGWRCV